MTQRPASDQRGFSLTEVLITTFLTMVVTGVALSTFQHANKSAMSASVMSDVNHNLRVAMNLVIRDLLQTGQAIPTGGIPLPRGGASVNISRPGPVGANQVFPPQWGSLPAISPGPDLGPTIAGVPTDLVTILRADSSLRLSDAPVQAIATDGSSVTIPANIPIDSPANGVKAGDLIMFSNGNGNAIQEVTDVVGQTIMFATNAPSNLNQSTAPQGSILELRNPNLTWPGTTVTRVLMLTYYLVDSSNGGGPIPSLVRRVNFGPERLLAIGIENLQLTWDLVDGVTNPTNLDQPVAPNGPNQIRKANLHMAGRSIDPTATGHHLHASLTTQVSLRSLAYVDRYR